VNATVEFLIRHGAVVLFVALVIEQVGLPFPATPVLLFAGALAGAAKLHWAPLLISGVLGSMVADLLWFYIGVFKGRRALKLLCRISLNPDSCVRRTQEAFGKYGMAGLVFGKFIPGFSTLLPPLAGSSGLSISRFLLFDGISSLLYCGSFILIGFVFSNQVEEIIAALARLGKGALGVFITFLAAYVAYKYFQRQRLLRELRVARITVDELHQKLQGGENPLLLDLRDPSELDQDPFLIRGALHVTVSDLEQGRQEIPRDREVIVYCSCPNEAGSARLALLLQRQGIKRARPLLGGIEAWRDRNYPLEERALRISNAPAAPALEATLL
jgi:membrane protein DedA with SNARE-associated domain/rhodanese-related sulfurtransferase